MFVEAERGKAEAGGGVIMIADLDQLGQNGSRIN